MPLYEFYCSDCEKNFESLLSVEESKANPPQADCPICKKTTSDKIVPLFRVGGRGDLRESSEFHGCHHHGHQHEHHHHHDHSHSHSSETPKSEKKPD